VTAAASVRIIADPGDPAEVGPALAAVQVGLWKSVAALYAQDQTPTVTTVWLNNPSNTDTWMVAPGLVGMIVMVTMLFLGGLTLVRERERGSWETLLATPVRPAEALIGKLAPYLAISLIQTAALLGIIHWLFGVPMPPTVWALLVMTPFFAGSYLVLGFAISTLAQTQLQAVQAAAFVYLPSTMLSGFMFPFTGMPGWAQALGEAIPLTHYIRATRDILIRGEPPISVAAHLWPVLVFITIASAIAVTTYRRRLD
jgi:ABC-2 type transport system permease protein